MACVEIASLKLEVVHLKEELDECAQGHMCFVLVDFQQWTPWCEWALEHGIRSLREVITRRLLVFVFNVLLSRHTPQWPEPRGIATSRKGDTIGHLSAGLPFQKLAGDQPKNWRAPTRGLAGRRIISTRCSPTSSPLCACVLLACCSRAFGHVDDLEAVNRYAERALPYGRRPDQPSSSSLATRVFFH